VRVRSVLIVAIGLMCSVLAAEAKYLGPNTRTLARTADLIALVEVKWTVPADKPEDKAQQLYSHVTVDVLETLKGDPKLKKLLIGTQKRMEEGDYGAYASERRYLVFLVKRGTLYRAAHGRSGIFEKIGYQISGWPKPGGPSYPKASTLVDYKVVKKEIAGYLAAPKNEPRGAKTRERAGGKAVR